MREKTLICFSMDVRFADSYFNALMRDFYGSNNFFAAGSPYFEVKGDKAFFVCPLYLPIKVGGVGKIVIKTVFMGFEHSAKKAGIKLKREVVTDDVENEYYRREKEELDRIK